MKVITIKTKTVKIPESYTEYLSMTQKEKIAALKYQDEHPEEFKKKA